MNRSPNSMEMDAMRNLAVNGEMYRTELPFAIVNECIKRGWIASAAPGFVGLTPDGWKTYEARR